MVFPNLFVAEIQVFVIQPRPEGRHRHRRDRDARLLGALPFADGGGVTVPEVPDLREVEQGRRYAQSPPSGLRRVVSNIEVLDHDGSEVTVGANFVLAESRERGVQTWAGRVTYRLRLVDGELRLAGKQVLLVNRDQPLPTLAFLI
jgi:hypothetical protein